MSDDARPLSDEQLIALAREGVTEPGEHAKPSWNHTDGRVRVGIWRAGDLLGRAEADGEDLSAAIRAAGSAAAAAVAGDLREAARATVLDVEVITESESIEPEGLSGLLVAIEPGIHGLVLRDGDRAAGGWPADGLRGGRGGARWTKSLLKQVRPPGVRLPPSADVTRFHTRQAVGPLDAPSDRPAPAVAMQGGTRVVPAERVTPLELVRAATLAGHWLATHQRKNGLFQYSYQERRRDWSRDDSIVRQAGCAWAVARLGRFSPDTGLVGPAAGAMQGIAARALKRGGPGNLTYLQAPGGPPRLGAIPLFLLAADEWGKQSPIDAGMRDRLAATLLAVQTRDGGFGTQSRGFELEGSETYYAGQISLALARRFAVTKRDRYTEAGLKSVGYYRDWWADGNQDLSFVTWMVQACDAWHQLREDETARDFAFEMADWALQFQHPADHPNPLWAGAFERTPGIGTAAYTEGIARALAIAKRVGDEDRVTRYDTSVRSALRFLLQLSMEDADLAFVAGPEHRGAVRSSLRRRNLRCDNAQHFIMAAIGASGVLTFEQPAQKPPARDESTAAPGC